MGVQSSRQFLVTGGAGFIGSALVHHLLADTPHRVLVVDALTYAGSLDNLPDPAKEPRLTIARADIRDAPAMRALFETHRPEVVMHLAAESHVDRSIDGPAAFIETNILGTYTLLQAALEHYQGLDREGRAGFRFHHVSTDEVFGSLGPEGLFREDTPYGPTSPYSASKAASDHLVRAWHHTYGLPTLTSNCSNNYGPRHFPEKLIPLVILNALARRPLPVYGRGENVRDWLFVEDHARALALIAGQGRLGESYNVGGRAERRNIEVVETVCALVDELAPDGQGPRRELIRFVADRPGHDARYAIDTTKIERELGWRPAVTFEEGLRRTVEWYLGNRWWWEADARGYQGERLGLGAAAAAGTLTGTSMGGEARA